MKPKTGRYLLMALGAVLLALAILVLDGTGPNASQMTGAVYIDEILASNHSFPNSGGLCCDYIEVHNASGQVVSLAGYGLTDTEKKVCFVFPEGTEIEPNGYYLLWCDGIATDMRVSREKSEKIYFADPQGKVLQTVDTLPCGPDEAMVLSQGTWILSDVPSPGYENSQSGARQYRDALAACRGDVVFSEALTSNSLYYHDGGQTCDWIELKNRSGEEVSLAGYTVSDGSGKTLYTFPRSAVIPAEGYFLLYCSEDIPGYAPFSLSKTKAETFVLRDPEGAPADFLCTKPCERNVSLVSCPDGSWTFSQKPTPGFSNDDSGYTAYLSAMGYDNRSVRITEVMGDNAATLANGAAFPDWLELTNFSQEEFDLENWYLSDSGDANGWQIHGITLSPGESRLVFCGRKGAELSLSSRGDTLYLRTPMGDAVDSVSYPALSPDESYSLDFGSGTWTVTRYPTPGYANDPEGYARFCHSRQPEGKLAISELQTANNTYFPYGYGEYYDWLELRNISDTPVLLSDYYLSDDRKDPAMYRLPETVLEPGEFFTVLCTGDASMTGNGYTCANFSLNSSRETLYIFDAARVPVDYTAISSVPGDCSFGRLPSGGFGYFTAPTPGYENGDGSGMMAAKPAAFPSGGIYEGESMEIALSGEGTVYYTLNGDVPTTGSAVYTGPIHIEKTTVIRAVSVREGMLASPVMTESYFLNEGHTLPVISLVSPGQGLFSNESGIYVEGNHVNYDQEWERSANVALYGAEGTEFQLDCGLKMFGAGSRESCEKKSFKLLFNGRYDGDLFCDVFGDGAVTGFHSLVLRAGEDYRFGLIRDNLLETLARQACPTLMTQNCRPAILYINGQYWGIYTIKEHFSEEYYGSHMNFDPDTVTVLRSPMTNTNPLRDLMIEAAYADMSNDDFLNRAAEMIDISSLIDWTIMQAYAGNNDINGNVRYIYSTEDGKWRWCYFDLDWSFYIPGHFSEVLMPDRQYSLLPRNLLENATFRERLCRRLAELSTTVLSSENVASVIDAYVALLEPEVARDHARWNLRYDSWRYYVDRMRALVTEHDRCRELMDSLCQIAGISDEEKNAYFGDLVEGNEKNG